MTNHRPRVRFFSSLLLPLLVLMVPGPSGGQVIPDSAIRAILQDRVATKRAVGIVLGLLDHGQRKLFVAGTAGAPAVALDGNTVFEIGSITKVFTASLWRTWRRGAR